MDWVNIKTNTEQYQSGDFKITKLNVVMVNDLAVFCVTVEQYAGDGTMSHTATWTYCNETDANDKYRKVR
jgi:hypothetical protein